MMTQLHHIFRRSSRTVRRLYGRLLVLAVAASYWCAIAADALAKRRDEVQPTPEELKSYVLPYMLVALSIALGLMVICRPGRRSDKPRTDNEAQTL